MKRVFVLVLAIILSINIFFLLFFKPKTLPISQLKTFSTQELNMYNGSDPNLPIYMSYNNDVYDVTTGREFYQTGGPYHDLAGKDSTNELNIAGDGIIKVKYTIIGRLIQ